MRSVSFNFKLVRPRTRIAKRPCSIFRKRYTFYNNYVAFHNPICSFLSSADRALSSQKTSAAPIEPDSTEPNGESKSHDIPMTLHNVVNTHLPVAAPITPPAPQPVAAYIEPVAAAPIEAFPLRKDKRSQVNDSHTAAAVKAPSADIIPGTMYSPTAMEFDDDDDHVGLSGGGAMPKAFSLYSPTGARDSNDDSPAPPPPPPREVYEVSKHSERKSSSAASIIQAIPPVGSELPMTMHNEAKTDNSNKVAALKLVPKQALKSKLSFLDDAFGSVEQKIKEELTIAEQISREQATESHGLSKSDDKFWKDKEKVEQVEKGSVSPSEHVSRKSSERKSRDHRSKSRDSLHLTRDQRSESMGRTRGSSDRKSKSERRQDSVERKKSIERKGSRERKHSKERSSRERKHSRDRNVSRERKRSPERKHSRERWDSRERKYSRDRKVSRERKDSRERSPYSRGKRSNERKSSSDRRRRVRRSKSRDRSHSRHRSVSRERSSRDDRSSRRHREEKRRGDSFDRRRDSRSRSASRDKVVRKQSRDKASKSRDLRSLSRSRSKDKVPKSKSISKEEICSERTRTDRKSSKDHKDISLERKEASESRRRKDLMDKRKPSSRKRRESGSSSSESSSSDSSDNSGSSSSGSGSENEDSSPEKGKIDAKINEKKTKSKAVKNHQARGNVCICQLVFEDKKDVNVSFEL